ncbi:class I ribonucleotide reductase maintenance protein YfaE [Candidatus Tachikawaea gelatinosa]|nr:class I ribonucleotide reductase maintenance protein YfaE [Candidatus Tachikawaea gelatinosa]
MSDFNIVLNTSRIKLKKIHIYLNLLNILEKNNIEIEFQCRQGYCGSCRMRLLKGKIIYYKKPLAFLKKGEILPCCCYIMSNLEIQTII